VVVWWGQIRRTGWVIKTLEAQVSHFLLGCKCPVSRGIVMEEQDLPHIQIFMNDGPNPLTWDTQLLSYWFSRNPADFQDSILRHREVGWAKELSATPPMYCSYYNWTLLLHSYLLCSQHSFSVYSSLSPHQILSIHFPPPFSPSLVNSVSDTYQC
jgi:hypothetical protein